jgi:selenocysteine lyase/cysteine desulfurase
LNNAGAALMPTVVAEALYDYLREEELRGGYETADAHAEDLKVFYTACARLLNCDPEEVAFVENATRAWDMAFYAFRFKSGDRILTTLSEYGSNVIAYLQQARNCGVETIFIPDDNHGQIDVHALDQMIDERVKLISISHIPTGGGLVNPAAEVGKIARSAGIPFLLDSCQAVGQIPLDVQAIGCDILTGTGRKYLRGPRGTGLMYVRKKFIEKLEPPFLDIHAAELLSMDNYEIRNDAKRFENWECFFAGKAALGVAIDYALAWGIDSIRDRIYQLAQYLRNRLSENRAIAMTDTGKERCGIVTFQSERLKAQDIKTALHRKQINVSVAGGSSSLVPYRQRGLGETVRASVHYYNTEDEIDHFVERLNEIL